MKWVQLIVALLRSDFHGTKERKAGGFIGACCTMVVMAGMAALLYFAGAFDCWIGP